MIILKAKYIIITPDIILENSSIAVEKGVVKDICYGPTKTVKGKTYDFGNSIISPGLINAHTHLEGPPLYGYVKNPLRPPQQFIKWAPKVIALRKSLKPSDYLRTIKQGYLICARNGITTLVDHTHLHLTLPAHRQAKLRRILVEETVALDKNNAKDSLIRIKKALNYARKYSNGMLKTGLAPHSPFSVSPELYKMLFKLTQKNKGVFSTHLSELKEEVEFLKTGKGKMLPYLKKIGRQTNNWRPPKTTPVGYMKKLGILKPPAFFIHCNYLSGNDIKLLAASGSSVVFCPNSYYYFGHRNHPFRTLLKAGVNVCLGTDGLGSNKDLSILSEMNFIRKHHRDLSPNEIFRMGTVNGARTIGLADKIGTLKTGYAADIAVFPINNNKKLKHPYDALTYLIEKTPQSIFTMVNGSILPKNIK
ncbi:MAG TPA: amidohydrolase family protein [Planctomycetota bacterium]|nr:amidohydrolase family protein [Planctomycetota bacterium]